MSWNVTNFIALHEMEYRGCIVNFFQEGSVESFCHAHGNNRCHVFMTGLLNMNMNEYKFYCKSFGQCPVKV